MNNETRIIEYCNSYLMDDSSVFFQYIERMPCFIFTKLPFQKYSNYINKLKAYIEYQKIRNYSIQQEIKKVFEFNKEVVGFKGAFLQQKYYDSNNIRLYSDIDLLVRPKDCRYIFNCLYESNYKVKKGETFWDNNPILIRLFDLKFFEKSCHAELLKNTGHTIITVELHGNLNKCSSGNLCFNVNKIIDNSIIVKTGEMVFKTFCPEDNIIYNMFHTIKHLSYISFSLNKNKMINLQNLYDVAQIIESENIMWDLFLKRCIEYNVLPYISLYINVFTDVFPNMIPQYVKKNIFDLASQVPFLWKPIYQQIMKIEPKDIILGNLHEANEIDCLYEQSLKSSSNEHLWIDYCKSNLNKGE